jgi:hypothetical protein
MRITERLLGVGGSNDLALRNFRSWNKAADSVLVNSAPSDAVAVIPLVALL